MYCNYSKDKFGNELTCILPPWEIDGSYLEFEEDLKVYISNGLTKDGKHKKLDISYLQELKQN